MNVKRREKDIIGRSINKYLEATTKDYSKYYEGSPTYITLYQYDSEASLQDHSLETVHSLVGKNTPNKYKRIHDVVVYGVDALDISTELSERGLENFVGGELIFLPDSVRPKSGDFFVFDYDGMDRHLFIINNVQFDKLTPTKYYRAQFKLYMNNPDEILENIEGDFHLDYSTIGGETSAIISSDTKENKEALMRITDDLIDKFVSLFYDYDTDSFLFSDDRQLYYWSPYLQKFMNSTKVLSKYNRELLTEIYITDINQDDNRLFYDEKTYRNSIYFAVETGHKHINFRDAFVNVLPYDLKMTRNLPYFNSPFDFKIISPIERIDKKRDGAYTNAINFMFDDSKPFGEVDHYHKVHIADQVHISRLEPYINDGDYIYECFENEIIPTKMFKAELTDGDIELVNVSLDYIFDEKGYRYDPELEVFNIIKKYFKGELNMDNETLHKLRHLYIDISMRNYLLVPVLIYILKQI